MTRLNTSDIDHINEQLITNDRHWKKTLGFTLEDIARRAVGYNKPRKRLKAAVVPITGGLGIIGGFCEAVMGILSYSGANAFITANTDVGGIREAYLKESDLIYMADDDVCAAFSTTGKITSDNGYATGIGFAAALELMMKTVHKQEVLILGAGPVGAAAAEYLSKKGAVPVVNDLLIDKAQHVAEVVDHARIEPDSRNMRKYDYIFDATTSGGFIKAEDITGNTRISAPGMPLGASEEVLQQIPVFHNPLELGIMTMYFDCMKQLDEYHHDKNNCEQIM